jgi:hypothetical protein
MAAGAGLTGPPTGAGIGPGWRRLVAGIVGEVPRAEIDAVWVFPVIRRNGREWGTAVLTRVDGERRRIYTARYMLVLKGKERGQYEWAMEEVGSGPADALAPLLQDVHKRTDDEHPPIPLRVDEWFAEATNGPAR